MADQCPTLTARGKPCRGRVPPGRVYCLAHDPARANARRAAQQWAAMGEQMRPSDLPAILRAAMISVRDGDLEPAQASAIATLAKTSVSITSDIELEARITALEEAAGLASPSAGLRRVK